MSLGVAYNPFIIVTLLYLLASTWEVGHLTRPDSFSKRWADRLPIAAFLLHTAFLGVLAARAGNIPITNLYESLILLIWCVVVVFITVEYVYNVPSMGAFLFPLVTVLSVWALVLKGNTLVASPNLSKFWLVAHTIPLFMGYAAFTLTFIFSVMYLTQQRQLKHKFFGPVFHGLPSLERLDTMMWKTLSFGFPLLTLGLVLGAFWLKYSNALGPQWYLDSKVVMGLVTWLFYAALLHLRVGVSMHGNKVAGLTIAAFILVLFTFLGTFFLGAQHGYQKVSKENSRLIIEEFENK
ncbi:MAG: inner membrane protein YpjD [Candidatus Brocadiales bacterium]